MCFFLAVTHKVLTWMTLGEGNIFFSSLYPSVSAVVQLSKEYLWKSFSAIGWKTGACLSRDSQVTGGTV